MGWIKSFFNRDPLDGVNRRLHKMKPEDITGRLQRGWRSYVKWRRRRRRLSSWYFNKVYPNRLIRSLLAIIAVFGPPIIAIAVSVGLILVTQSIFPNLTIISSMMIGAVDVALFFLIMCKLFSNVEDIQATLYSLDMDKQYNNMRTFFELHPHDLIARLHESIKDPNFFEKHYDALDNPVYNATVELPDCIYRDIPTIRHGDDFQETETAEEEDSTSYGTMKLLYNLFLHLLGASSRDLMHKRQNWSAKIKTFELIHFMWNKNHMPLESSTRETGLLVRAWSDLSVGRLSWDEYYGMVDAMMARMKTEASAIAARDRKEVIDRLMDLKHDSDVMNDSQSLTRMRDLVGRLHESSTELTGKTVTQ